MSGYLTPTPIQKFFDNNGNPLAFGLVYTYQAGTTTPAATYTDSTLVTANTNPIVLNFRGEAPIWIPSNTAYKFNVTDANGNQLPGWPIDQIQDPIYTPTQASIAALLNPVTAAETALGITPTNYLYNPDFLDPRRYGAVGDGATDDTGAINTWISVVNEMSTLGVNPVSTWFPGLVYLCGPLNALTASNFTWNCWSTLRSKPNSITGATSWITVSCATFRLYGLKMDGNQANYSAGAGNAEMYLNAVSDLVMDSCSFVNSTYKGVLFYQVSGARISNCHFDSNANLGMETNAASYLKFVDCTFDYNGYGFQKTLASNTFAAFAFALRFRTHHCTFVECQAKQNGRDGMNTNQGSYAIKYIGCLAWMNGDGGFTIASDNTGSGLPGEAEACYDIEFVDCEAYNNWSSGLSAYNTCFNVTVDGGRYYNNNRLAGTQVLASAYFSGVYITQSSQGIRVRCKAYDDRQLCPITAYASNVVTATNWGNLTGTGFIATAANYPKVAFYNANMVFQGYATISAESAGSVTVATLPNNGVTLASITAGWYITQRVQHNGVFFDNGVQGEIDVDAFGLLPGPAGYSGFKSVVGYLGNGQNVLLPGAPDDYTELLANPSFDANVTNWTANNSGGTGALSYTTTAAQIRSAGGAALAGGTNGCVADGTLITSGVNFGNNCYVEASMWCLANSPGDAYMQFFWNPGTGTLSTTVQHPGGGWKQLKIGLFIPAGNTSLLLRMASIIGKTNYFDTAKMRVKADKTDNRDYSYPTRNLPV